MKKKIVALICFLIGISFFCYSHGAEKHDEFFKFILFGSDVGLDAKENEKLILLDYASRIAIDQYNGSYEYELNFLKSKGINTITSIKDIDYTSNQYHQRYTHLGWTFSYPRDVANWELRKKLLLATTNKVFKFNSNEQHDAFAALMYYIHIIGDHHGDDKNNAYCRMALGGRSDSLDILDELSIYIPRLFKKQKSEANALCERLQTINQKCSALLKRKGEEYDDRNVKREVMDLTPEEYKTYQRYARDTLKVLSEEVPNLLRNEKWFTKVYSSVK